MQPGGHAGPACIARPAGGGPIGRPGSHACHACHACTITNACMHTPATMPCLLCPIPACMRHHRCHSCHAMPCLLHHPCHACHAMPHQLHACLSMQVTAGSPSAAARRKHKSMVRCSRQMERCKHAAGPTSWLNGVRIRYEPRMTVPADGWLRAVHKVMTRDPLRRDGKSVARSFPFDYDWEDPWAVASCLPALPRLYQCADQSTPGLLPMPRCPPLFVCLHHSLFACLLFPAGAHRSLRRSARSGHGQRDGVRSFTI